MNRHKHWQMQSKHATWLGEATTQRHASRQQSFRHEHARIRRRPVRGQPCCWRLKASPVGAGPCCGLSIAAPPIVPGGAAQRKARILAAAPCCGLSIAAPPIVPGGATGRKARVLAAAATLAAALP
jgi:hypothetical protein